MPAWLAAKVFLGSIASVNPPCPKARGPVTFQGCPGGFTNQDPLRAWTVTSNRRLTQLSASLLQLGRQTGSTGILNLSPITYAFRPRLRDRLTLGGRTFPRKSWDFGGRDFHPAYRYSCPHNHFHTVHYLRAGGTGDPCGLASTRMERSSTTTSGRSRT